MLFALFLLNPAWIFAISPSTEPHASPIQEGEMTFHMISFNEAVSTNAN
jgi:hypothetical protein